MKLDLQKTAESLEAARVDNIRLKKDSEETKLELHDREDKLRGTELRLEKNEIKLKENLKDLSQNRKECENLKYKFDQLGKTNSKLDKEIESLQLDLKKTTEQLEAAKVDNIQLKRDSDEYCQKLREKNEKLMDENKKWEVENDRLQMGWKEDREKLKQLEGFRPQRKFQRRRWETSNPRSWCGTLIRDTLESAKGSSWKTKNRFAENQSKAAGQRMNVAATRVKVSTSSVFLKNRSSAGQASSNRKRRIQENPKDETKTNNKTSRKFRYIKNKVFII